MVTLTVYRGGRPVQELDLEGPEIKIGRGSDNQVVLPDDGHGVSRVHAVIRVEGNHYILYDNKSRNGTVVGGKRITQAVLQPGQEFVIGPFRIAFNLGEPGQEGAEPPTMMTAGSTLPPPDTVGRGEPIPQGPTQTLTNRSTDRWPSWVADQPRSVMYGLGGLAVTLIGIVLIWQFWPGPSKLDTLIAENVSTTTSTTTTIPDPPRVTLEEVAAVREALASADTMIPPAKPGQRIPRSQYEAAILEYERVIAERIQPLLDREPTNTDVLDLLTRAQDSIANARPSTPGIVANSTTTTTIPAADQQGVQRRAGETDEDYDRRNKQAKDDHDRGRSLLKMGDLLEAFRLLSALGAREPTLPGINPSINDARAALERARQEAEVEGPKLNQAAYEELQKRNFAAAVPLLTAAWKLLDRAVALEAPNVGMRVKENQNLRQHAAEQIIDLARNWGNDSRDWDRARTHFRWVVDLLPGDHPLRKEAESAIKKLGG